MEKESFKGEARSDQAVLWIAFSALLFTFYWFFIRTVFLNPDRIMQVIESVRRLDPIGYDLMMMLSHSTAWLNHTISPFASFNNFPPFAMVLFAPLSLIPIELAYHLLTLLTLACFLWAGFFFPLLSEGHRKIESLLMLLFIVGLTSYGLQFELERGQFNTLAIGLTFAAIYIFHRHPRLSWLAYILFTIGIQLKIYPAIFIFLFIRDWRSWKENIIRWVGLGIANLLLLFSLGYAPFLHFLEVITKKSDDPGAWVGNISIKSFAQYRLPYLLSRLGIRNEWITPENSVFIEFGLYLLVIILLAIVVVRAYRRNDGGIAPYMLFACLCAAFLIPPISHDYKLPILVGPAAYLLLKLPPSGSFSGRRKILFFGLTAVFTLTYFSTQFSYMMKTPLLASNFPAVFLMLIVCISFYFMDERVTVGIDSA